MLASSIAISNFPLLHFEDKASFALQCMEDYDIQHLPLVKEEYFVGLVNKEDVLNLATDQTLIHLADQLTRSPKPPGTRIASTSFKRAAPSSSIISASI